MAYQEARHFGDQCSVFLKYLLQRREVCGAKDGGEGGGMHGVRNEGEG